jgi:hypothetical protein
MANRRANISWESLAVSKAVDVQFMLQEPVSCRTSLRNFDREAEKGIMGNNCRKAVRAPFFYVLLFLILNTLQREGNSNVRTLRSRTEHRARIFFFLFFPASTSLLR